jgi:hypothetical protein
MPDEFRSTDLAALWELLADSTYVLATNRRIIQELDPGKPLAALVVNGVHQAMSNLRDQLEQFLQDRLGESLHSVAAGLGNLPDAHVQSIVFAEGQIRELIRKASDLSAGLATAPPSSFSVTNVEDLRKIWDTNLFKGVPTKEEMHALFHATRIRLQQIEDDVRQVAHGADREAASAIYRELKGSSREFGSVVRDWQRRVGVRFYDSLRLPNGRRRMQPRMPRDVDAEFFYKCNLPPRQQASLQEELAMIRRGFAGLNETVRNTIGWLLLPTERELEDVATGFESKVEDLRERSSELLDRKSVENPSKFMEAVDGLLEQQRTIESELNLAMYDLRQRAGISDLETTTASTSKRLPRILSENELDERLCQNCDASETHQKFGRVREALFAAGETLIQTKRGMKKGL